MNTTLSDVAPTCSHQQCALNSRIMFNCLIAALLLALSAVTQNPAAAQNRPQPYGQDDDIVDRSWPPANPRSSYNSAGDNHVGRDKRHLDNNILRDTGTWHQHPQWSNVWRPEHNRYWRPYTVGTWKSDANNTWKWVSTEAFGKLVFHYGRWTVDPGLGWVWIPGSTWAPAWVIWRTNVDYVGWAPLPPGSQRIDHTQSRKIDFDDADLFEDDWVFVRRTRLTSRNLDRNILPRDDNIDLIDITSPARDPNQFASRGDQPRYNQRGNEFPNDTYRDDPYEDDTYDDGLERLDARTVEPWGHPVTHLITHARVPDHQKYRQYGVTKRNKPKQNAQTYVKNATVTKRKASA